MTIEIREIWKELESTGVTNKFVKINKRGGNPDLRLYVAHPHSDLPAIEVRLASGGRGRIRPRRYHGFEVRVEQRQWGVSDVADMVMILCRIDSLEDQFQSFVQTIVDNLANGQAPHSAVEIAIDKWVSFFSKNSASKRPQELLGLFGELLFLFERLKSSKNTGLVIDGWKGPLGEPWDFVFPDPVKTCFVEVKTTGSVQRRIIVNGIDQFWAADTTHNQYWLYWQRANWYRQDDGQDTGSIFALIKEIQTYCSSISEVTRISFENALAECGLTELNDESRRVYQAIKITPGRGNWIAVDSSYPALHRGSVSNPAVLQRVEDVSYAFKIQDEDIVQEGPDFAGL